MTSPTEIIERIDEYLKGEINEDYISEWAHKQMTPQNPENIDRALILLGLLNESEEHNLSMEELLALRDEMVDFNFIVANYSELDESVKAYWIGYTKEKIVSVIKLSLNNNEKILEHFVKDWSGKKIHSHQQVLQIIREKKKDLKWVDVLNRLARFNKKEISVEELVQFSIDSLQYENLHNIYLNLLWCYARHDDWYKQEYNTEISVY